MTDALDAVSRAAVLDPDDVQQFMELGHPGNAADTPRIPPSAIATLCRELVIEEESELLVAMSDQDIVEIADAIGDSIYVLIYTAHCYGIPLAAVWREICDTNLNKVTHSTGIHRDPGTNKILKPPGWMPPDIAGILAAVIPRQVIYCPYCCKPHIDAGSFALTPHRTHLCDLTPGGEGCGKRFTLNELVFGVTP